LRLRALAKIIKIVEIPVSVINKVGVGRANQIGFRSVIHEVQKECAQERFFVLADGFQTKYVRGVGLKRQKAIIKGDQKSFTIASASILAKVYRDTLMKQLGQRYDKYAFARHKGYGTSLHRKLLQEHGMCELHRIAFCQSTLHRVT
jgi:ribonuclease HII